MNKRDVVVIGGGVIGLVSAYYLLQQGASVTVVDKGPRKQASSHGNCGLISPSHIMPLNSFKLILESLRMISKPDAPFRIKPQANLDFMRWLLGFLAKSMPSSVRKSTIGRMQLLLSSAELFKALMQEKDFDCEWSDKGILFVFRTSKAFQEYGISDKYSRNFGISGEQLVGRELFEMEPSLREDLYGAWFYEIDNWLRPDDFISEISDRIQKMGGEIHSGREVSDFKVDNKVIKEVIADDGTSYSSTHFLLATGAWSPLLAKSLGFRLPIIPGKGYSITMKPPSIAPSRPCILMERKVVATPWSNGYRLGSTMEFAGYDETLNEVRLTALKKGAEEYLKVPYSQEITEKWWGWRPMTYDGLPIIGKAPKWQNLWLATGHSMLGMSMSTGTGKLISELITGEQPHLDPAAFSPDRFRLGF